MPSHDFSQVDRAVLFAIWTCSDEENREREEGDVHVLSPWFTRLALHVEADRGRTTEADLDSSLVRLAREGYISRYECDDFGETFVTTKLGDEAISRAMKAKLDALLGELPKLFPGST